MILNGHTKEKLQSLDTQMREGLGNSAEHHQPRQLREQIHSGRLKIKRSEGNAFPVKQHPEYHVAEQIVKEREQRQGTAGRSTMQEAQQAHPFFSSSSHWDGWWTSLLWDKAWQLKE